MLNMFEKELKILRPTCCSLGDCCKGASPSKPWHVMLKRAGEGDEFGRQFFSIMIPYASHEEAAKVVPGLVERTKRAAKKNPEQFQSDDDLVFYRCRYLREDNRCGVHEDRPQFCRDYPDTPFVVMPPGCAFEPWERTCRAKYNEMKAEVAQLKQLQAELDDLRKLQSEIQEAQNPDGA